MGSVCQISFWRSPHHCIKGTVNGLKYENGQQPHLVFRLSHRRALHDVPFDNRFPPSDPGFGSGKFNPPWDFYHMGRHDLPATLDLLGRRGAQKPDRGLEQGPFDLPEDRPGIGNPLGTNFVFARREPFIFLFREGILPGRANGHEMVLAAQLWHWHWKPFDPGCVLGFIALQKTEGGRE